MTASNEKMACEACRDALTELVCNELDAAAEASVREHLASCPACSAQLERFGRVMTAAADLPLDVPSPRVREHVMAQAREALTRRTAAKPAVSAAEAAPSGLRAWLERLGHWAMAPQVAMATVLLLVVGLGLYALPFGAREPRAALTPALDVHPSEGAESAAATTAPVAEVEAEQMRDLAAPALQAESKKAYESELRTRRAAPARDEADGMREKASKAKKPSTARSGGGAEFEDSLGGAGEGLAAAQNASAPRKRASSKAELEERAADDRMQGPFAPPPPAPAPKGATGSYGGAAVADKMRAEPAASVASAPAESEASETASQPGSGASVDEGVRRAQAGDTAAAIRILRPLTGSGSESDRQKARLWLARSYRSSGDCKSALPHYEVLTGKKEAASSVLNEAADCYTRVGNDAQASALRSRAKSSASTPKAAAEQAQ